MSRKKGKGKGKGSVKNTPQRTPAKRHTSQPWPTHESTPRFSLMDEARHTSMSNHRTAAFETGKKLRQMPIQFVSAGHLEGTIKKDLLPAELAVSESDNDSPAPSSPSSTQENTDAMAHMAIRSPSPAASDTSSSSDEVVFKGRGPVSQLHSAPLDAFQPAPREPTHSKILPPAPTTSTTTKLAVHVAVPAMDLQETPQTRTTQLPAASAAVETTLPALDPKFSAEATIRTKANPVVVAADSSDSDGVVEDPFAKRRGGRPVWEGMTTPWEHRSKPNIGWLPVGDRPDMEAFLRGQVNPRDAAMDDYMQNMEDFGLTGDMMAASGFARREMDLDAGTHNDWESASGSQHESQGRDQREEAQGIDGWDSDMLQDLENLSTSSDVMDTVVRILSKRTRNGGPQYLCVYEGSVVDDAHWLPGTFLKGSGEKRLVRAFEEEAFMRELEFSDSESTDDDKDDDEEEEEDEDEEELDDETIARVLQKQEELGLGSDELLLYGGDNYFSGHTNTVLTNRNHGRGHRKQKARGRNNRDPTFPSATAMADALAMDPYGGFDIMDTERPSLKAKKKERRGQMPPELDDSDLNEQLQNAWEADRMKKRLKKAEREELRQQGLLGRKGKGANLKVKYSGGVTMEDVVEEIREFLLGDSQSMSLPPMDAHRRATIHQAAKFFELSSRSRGDGQDRFTVLSRTSRTRTYTDAEFDRAISHRGFVKRLRGPLQGKSGGGPSRAAIFRSGPRTRPQVGYRDGEKVGANAPELGPENKGHALMMKMGWSKGMALGTEDNQGILHPIAHTVKTNKAGLQ
ncbi:protein SQS1 [Parastagonospora nodorum]|nr:protein SQS1 [Parastagonospora nodorum]KAH4010768.1 protein SQS1 [Parastagonospora nodorum]KAH4187746.1 protein SQS1 [Parastagonospora nodorum]KAH4193616.1 protein SQS1 [Parastagonospora nodorum]KAH4217493.1 protein SQS1 [Parastagonospora nodorum]